MGLKLLKGRDIDITKYPADSSAILLNKTAARIMGFDNPVGQILRNGNETWHVVGMVEDFITDNPYAPVVPAVIQGPKYDMGTWVRSHSGLIRNAVPHQVSNKSKNY